MKRIAELDGVRGIAILLVLIWHYIPCQVGFHRKTIASDLGSVLWFTWSGVDLFFVLSGFLIAGILIDHRKSPNYFSVFYFRRACRIFPLYFILLAIFFFLARSSVAASPAYGWLFNDPLPFWSYATFSQNVLMGARGDYGPNWLGVTWSLAVEEQFYLLLPFAICYLPRRVLLWVLVLAVLAAPVLRAASPGFHAFVNVPWRGDSLLSGATLAVLVRSQPFVSAVQRHRLILLLSFVGLLAGAVLMAQQLGLRALGDAFSHFWLAGLYSTFVLIAYLGTEIRLAKILRSPVLVWFGQLSYGIYLLHQPVSGLLHGALRNSFPQIRNLADVWITLLALCVTLILAVLSFHFLERPFLNYGHRIKFLPTSGGVDALQAAPRGNAS